MTKPQDNPTTLGMRAPAERLEYAAQVQSACVRRCAGLLSELAGAEYFEALCALPEEFADDVREAIKAWHEADQQVIDAVLAVAEEGDDR